MNKISPLFAFVLAIVLSGACTSQNAIAKPKKIDSKSFLSGGVWRTDNCAEKDFFQSFDFKSQPANVEVGAGALGEGEKLQILSTGFVNGMIEVRTTVCAPVGCNKTWEQYKILGKDMMQEWNFEGHLPDQAPNVVVKNGIAFDGSKGRIFKKCKS